MSGCDTEASVSDELFPEKIDQAPGVEGLVSEKISVPTVTLTPRLTECVAGPNGARSTPVKLARSPTPFGMFPNQTPGSHQDAGSPVYVKTPAPAKSQPP